MWNKRLHLDNLYLIFLSVQNLKSFAFNFLKFGISISSLNKIFPSKSIIFTVGAVWSYSREYNTGKTLNDLFFLESGSWGNTFTFLYSWRSPLLAKTTNFSSKNGITPEITYSNLIFRTVSTIFVPWSCTLVFNWELFQLLLEP